MMNVLYRQSHKFSILLDYFRLGMEFRLASIYYYLYGYDDALADFKLKIIKRRGILEEEGIKDHQSA
jgi:hypothetical protein